MVYVFDDSVVQRTEIDNTKDLARDILKNNKNQDDSFFIMNVDEIIEQHRTWENYLPNIKPYFALKCNSSPVVIKVLAALGVNFDCASQGEIQKVLNADVSPDRIVFANPNKQISHIKYAASVGVNLMTFDNVCELKNIKKYHPNAQLLLRVAADAENIVNKMSSKFGVSPQVAESLVKQCQHLDLELVGVCFHVGSFCEDPRAFDLAMRLARQVYDYCRNSGIHLRMVDLGGGFINEKFDLLAASVQRGIQENFRGVDVEFIAEPGRFYVNNAYTLMAQVFSCRYDDECDHPIYFINDSLTKSFAICLFENQSFEVETLNEHEGNDYTTSIIAGQTCNPVDYITKNCPLPNLEVGEWLLFTNMGAYSLVLMTNFHEFPSAKVHHTAKNSWQFLRKNVPELTKPVGRVLKRNSNHLLMG